MISSNHDIEKKREFDLSDHLKKIINSMRPEMDNYKHKILLDTPENIIINSFPGVFTQIIMNLINNSILHGLADTINGTIYIKLSKIDNEISINYRDNGKGCSVEELNIIFNPFYTTLRSTGHSGLGLTIVYNLIRNKLSGRIVCNQEEGQGLTFDIFIPV